MTYAAFTDDRPANFSPTLDADSDADLGRQDVALRALGQFPSACCEATRRGVVHAEEQLAVAEVTKQDAVGRFFAAVSELARVTVGNLISKVSSKVTARQVAIASATAAMVTAQAAAGFENYRTDRSFVALRVATHNMPIACAPQPRKLPAFDVTEG